MMGVKISESLSCSLWSVGSLPPSLLLKAWLVEVSEQVARALSSRVLKTSKNANWTPLGNLLYCWGVLVGIRGFPYIQAQLFTFQFDHCLLSCHHCKEPLSFESFLVKYQELLKDSLKLSVLQAEQPSSFM